MIPAFLTSRLAGFLGIGGTVLLGIALAFTVLTKNATIRELRTDKAALAAKVEQLTTDLTQCRANRLTLEEALARQTEAVSVAKAASEARVASLEAAASKSARDAASARREATRILARGGTGDACRDADALILEEAGR